jgi:hypothetical protein
MDAPKKNSKNKATFIAADTKLRDKIRPHTKLEQLIDSQKLLMAQDSIYRNVPLFESQADEDLQMLEEAYAYVQSHEDGLLPAMHDLYTASFRLKSMAGTFGFTLGSSIAKQLHDMVDGKARLSPHLLEAVGPHIQALKAIFRHNIRGDGGVQGKELLESLRELIAKKK